MLESTLTPEPQISGRPVDLEAPASNNRRYERLSYDRPIVVSIGKGLERQLHQGDGTDISPTGVRAVFQGEPFLRLGTKVNIKLAPSADVPFFREVRTLPAVVSRVDSSSAISWTYSFRFLNIVQPDNKSGTEYSYWFSTLFTLAAVAAICLMKAADLRWFWYAPTYRLYGILGGAFFISRTFLSLIYRTPKDRGYMPSATVIISVKNEEGHIAETVKRCFGVRYPSSKLELIVIDDGSDDNTWGVLQSIKDQYPKLKLFRFERNLGKRHGMALGAREATGEILVYVDSDSYIEPEGIYRLVQPFADSDVGAVAGHTRVIVEPNNPISKMESVRYHISHQIFKTAESVFGTVTCCPGAFSAYRRKLVLRVLPTWLNQTFLGVKATFGDDRSLTNHILRTHRVLYHATANCVTYVPDTWSKFFRQQLRWKKSWVRETTVASRIMIHKHPLAAVSYYIGVCVTFLSPFVFARAVLYGPLVHGQAPYHYLAGLFFVYGFLCVLYLIQTRQRHWYYGMLFAVCYLAILCWQTFYAVVTVNKSHWGTR